MYENYYNENNMQNEPENRPEKKNKKDSLGKKIFIAVLCGILFGSSAAAAFAGVNALFKSENPDESG